MSAQPISANDTLQSSYVFGQQHPHCACDLCEHVAERRALTYLNRHAPDLIGMVMGHIL